MIAGGGIAALEAALTLGELAGGAIATTLLTPRTTFTHRPLNVLEPFAGAGGRSYDLIAIARAAGARVCHAELERVDAERRLVHTTGGQALPYDVLLIAYGAEVGPRFKHARTIDDRYLGDRLHGLVRDVEDGYVRRVAFVTTGPPAWPLPLYELALMTSRAAYDMSAEMSVFIVTPERSPLEVFGDVASRTVASLLEHHGIELVTAPACDVPAPGRVTVGSGRAALRVQSVVAMPHLAPRRVAGVPVNVDGFIEVDANCRVGGLSDVYAAGDATAFAVKHGSIAALQADAAATEIARQAGADVPPEPFHPVLHGMLLGADRPLYLRARLSAGGRPLDSEASDAPLWHPPGKIAARRLGPYLRHADQLTGSFSHAEL